jgi:hypothetical protein
MNLPFLMMTAKFSLIPPRENLFYKLVETSAPESCAFRQLFFSQTEMSTMDIDSGLVFSNLKGKGKQTVPGNKDNLPW